MGGKQLFKPILVPILFFLMLSCEQIAIAEYYNFKPGEEIEYSITAEGEAEFGDEIKSAFYISLDMEFGLTPLESSDGEKCEYEVFVDKYESKWGDIEIFETENDFRKIYEKPLRVMLYKENGIIKEDGGVFTGQENDLSFGIPKTLFPQVDDIFIILFTSERRISDANKLFEEKFASFEINLASDVKKLSISNLGPQEFITFMLPALPDTKTLVEGDTWKGNMSIISPFTFYDDLNIVEAEFTWNGYDDYNGTECAKFSVAVDKDVAKKINLSEHYSQTEEKFRDDFHKICTFDMDYFEVELDSEIYIDRETGGLVATEFSLRQNMATTFAVTWDFNKYKLDDFRGEWLKTLLQDTNTRYYMDFNIEGTIEMK